MTLILAVVLAVGLCAPAMAASNPGKVIGFNPDLLDFLAAEGLSLDNFEEFLGEFPIFQFDKNDNFVDFAEYDDLSIQEGDTLVFWGATYYLASNGIFLFENPIDFDADDFDPDAFMDHCLKPSTYSKMKIGQNLGKWSPYVKDISLKNHKITIEGETYRFPAVVIEFADTFTNMKEEDFEFKWTMSIGGKKATVNLGGTFSFEEVEVEEGQEETAAGAGRVLKPLGHSRNIAIELEEGVTLTTTLSKDRKVRAQVTSREIDEFDPLYESHKGLVFIYTLSTTNISHGTITFDVADPQMYVYNAEGTYLGTTKDSLPLGKTYFLCDYKADHIIPPVLEEGGEEKPTQDMTLAEYILYLKTGVLPERLQATPEPEVEPVAEGEAATA